MSAVPGTEPEAKGESKPRSLGAAWVILRSLRRKRVPLVPLRLSSQSSNRDPRKIQLCLLAKQSSQLCPLMERWGWSQETLT